MSNFDRKKWVEFLQENGTSEKDIQKIIEEEERLEKIREEKARRSKERSEKIKKTHAQHKRLVSLGANWLLKHSPSKSDFDCLKSGIVVTEITSFTSESPDVLGFANDDKTVLLEAKISRADFKRDSKKHFRIYPKNGMGDFRMYITPPGLIKKEELPNGWGLLEVGENDRIKVIKYAEKQEADKRAEHIVLKSIIRRIGQNPPEGVSIKCYVHETKNNTTLLINKERGKK